MYAIMNRDSKRWWYRTDKQYTPPRELTSRHVTYLFNTYQDAVKQIETIEQTNGTGWMYEIISVHFERIEVTNYHARNAR